MSAEISDFAIRRILKVLNDTRRNPYDGGVEWAREVNQRWSVIYRLYFVIEPTPSLGYLRSAEFTLTLKDYDAKAIFAHGKPLIFKECPRLLAAKLVEGFLRLQNEPFFLDVTAVVPCLWPGVRPSDVWPDVYAGYLPCYACTTVISPVADEPLSARRNFESSDDGTVTRVVEKFHIRSKNFSKLETDPLTRPDVASDEKKSWLDKVAFRLEDVICAAQGCSGIKRAEPRPPAAIVRLLELASDVYGFLDRVHVGTSLVANRALTGIISRLAHHLPIHHLMCEFERDAKQGGCRRFWTGFYWFTLTHLRRDLSYDDERRFKMPSGTAATASKLIRHYLSNSHVARLLMPNDSGLDLHSNPEIDEIFRREYRFALRMLADAAKRNVSVGNLRLFAGDDHLTDYRSMDAVFGRMRIGVLDLRADEDRFVGLSKTTDFFRLTAIQGLKELKLDLRMPSDKKPKVRSCYPLWTAGITHLSECSYYEVDYCSEQPIARGFSRHVQSIASGIVTICERFERGQITATVEHFALRTFGRITYSFNSANMFTSDLRVTSEERGMLRYFCWDVYRFRNAATDEWLTACVGRDPPEDDYSTVYLHILKGEALPNAAFAYFRNALV